jgi:hypothetical protein
MSAALPVTREFRTTQVEPKPGVAHIDATERPGGTGHRKFRVGAVAEDETLVLAEGGRTDPAMHGNRRSGSAAEYRCDGLGWRRRRRAGLCLDLRLLLLLSTFQPLETVTQHLQILLLLVELLLLLVDQRVQCLHLVLLVRSGRERRAGDRQAQGRGHGKEQRMSFHGKFPSGCRWPRHQVAERGHDCEYAVKGLGERKF